MGGFNVSSSLASLLIGSVCVSKCGDTAAVSQTQANERGYQEIERMIRSEKDGERLHPRQLLCCLHSNDDAAADDHQQSC